MFAFTPKLPKLNSRKSTSFFASQFRSVFTLRRRDRCRDPTLTNLVMTPGLDDAAKRKEQGRLDGEDVPYQAPPGLPERCPRPSDATSAGSAPFTLTAPPSPSQPAMGAEGEAKSQAPGDQGAGPRSSGTGQVTSDMPRPPPPRAQHSPRGRPLSASPSPHFPFQTASGKREAPTPALHTYKSNRL